MKYRLSASLLAIALLVAPAVAQTATAVADDYAEEMVGAEAEALEGDCEAEEALEEAEETISPAAKAALEQTRVRMEQLADMLASVVDAASAEAMAPRIVEAFDSLKYADFSSLAEEDEEMVAAEFAEDMVARLDAELERLSDAGFYGNPQLLQFFSASEGTPDSAPAKEVDFPEEREVDIPAQEAGTESVRS